MLEKISKLLDYLSDFLAERKGLIPFLGIILIGLNLSVKILFGNNFITDIDLFLHLGVIVSVFGLMLARVL